MGQTRKSLVVPGYGNTVAALLLDVKSTICLMRCLSKVELEILDFIFSQ